MAEKNATKQQQHSIQVDCVLFSTTLTVRDRETTVRLVFNTYNPRLSPSSPLYSFTINLCLRTITTTMVW